MGLKDSTVTLTDDFIPNTDIGDRCQPVASDLQGRWIGSNTSKGMKYGMDAAT
jgi:hypothetical protein